MEQNVRGYLICTSLIRVNKIGVGFDLGGKRSVHYESHSDDSRVQFPVAWAVHGKGLEIKVVRVHSGTYSIKAAFIILPDGTQLDYVCPSGEVSTFMVSWVLYLLRYLLFTLMEFINIDCGLKTEMCFKK